VARVHATVKLQSSIWEEIARSEPHDSGRSPRRIQLTSHPESLSLHISLSAQDSAGRYIRTGQRDFGVSGPRRGVWHRWHGPLSGIRRQASRVAMFEHRVDVHDIEDSINQMLGRDPTLHRPPRLAWGNLIRALEQVGVTATEQDLIAAPLTIEVTPEVQVELDAPG